MARDGSASLYRPGSPADGQARPPGRPLRAHTGRELVPSWLGQRLPFGQVHGHDSLYDWGQRQWRATEAVIRHTTLDRARSHETTGFAVGAIIGVDPEHGVQARADWRAWSPSTDGCHYFMPEVSTPSTR